MFCLFGCIYLPHSALSATVNINFRHYNVAESKEQHNRSLQKVIFYLFFLLEDVFFADSQVAGFFAQRGEPSPGYITSFEALPDAWGRDRETEGVMGRGGLQLQKSDG